MGQRIRQAGDTYMNTTHATRGATILQRVALLGALLLAPLVALADDDLARFAPTAGTGSTAADFDHGPWQRFLDTYLVTDDPRGVNLVRYASVSTADRAKLDAHIDTLTTADPRTASRDAQMAYWINLYNAVTVRLILDDPSIDSIRDLSSGLFSRGPWKRDVVTVSGVDLSLDDIEHGILRPYFTDARIHFAVNCASIGCPDLAASAYTAENLEALLDGGARAYLAHPRGLRLEGSTLHLSSIFDWYREDFPADRDAFLAWLADYAPEAQRAALRAFDGRIRHDYDWSLNRAR